MFIQKFQYLSFDIPTHTHAELAQKACLGGCKWIQLRTKNKSLEDWIAIAKTVKKVCDAHNCQLIINDSVEVCKAVDASGVHLGKNDMQPLQARKILGEHKIIGATAANFEDIVALNQQKTVNYIGCGPFKFTQTKQNLSPIVGLKGYETIMEQTKKNNIGTPIIAIGGIEFEDIAALMHTGIYGVAVSSAIHGKGDVELNTRQFVDFLL